MEQLSKSADLSPPSSDESNRADGEVEAKEREDDQENNAHENQALAHGPKLPSPSSIWELEFRRLSLLFSSTRRIFRTHENYLGNGPKSARPGDQVWILAGAKIPFVLRPQENGKYVVVGDAYVHGIMHGEAFEKQGFEFVNIQLE